MKIIYFLVFMSLLFNFSRTYGQKTIPLYKGSIPNSKPHSNQEKSIMDNGRLIISKISLPELTLFTPEKKKNNHTAILICPGGGYWVEAAGHEGAEVARSFTELGYTTFLLKYRIPDDSTMVNKEIGPLQDAQRGIQFIRENASKFKVHKNRIGILGFSAGGHLASTAGTHYKMNYIENPKNTSLRPDFMILIYPVISFTDSIGHMGSRTQLLGKNPDPEKILEYSNEFHVDAETPPTYLVMAKDDPINSKNATVFYSALKDHGVESQMYLFEKGGHGFGLSNKTSEVKWINLVDPWIGKLPL